MRSLKRMLVALSLLPVPTAFASPPELEIALHDPLAVSQSVPAIDVRFKNVSHARQQIIKPQDGSFYGWLPPHYDCKVVNLATGETIPLPPRCGTFGGEYTADTMVNILPGKTVSVVTCPSYALPAGQYVMQLSYHVPEKTYPGERYRGGRGIEKSDKAWPDGVFVGKATSQELTFLVHQLDQGLVPRIVEVIEDEHTTEAGRLWAVCTLKRLGPKATPATGALTALLNVETQLGLAAIEAIEAIGPSAAAAAPKLTQLLPEQNVIRTLGALGPDAAVAVPSLTKILSGEHPWSRHDAADALGQIHARADVAVPALLAYLAWADDPNHRHRKSERRFAIRALGRFGREAVEAVDVIRQYTDSDDTGFQYSVDSPKNDLGDVATEALRQIEAPPDDKDEQSSQRPATRDDTVENASVSESRPLNIEADKAAAHVKQCTEFAFNLLYRGPEETDDPLRPKSIQFVGPGLPAGVPPTIDTIQVRLTKQQVDDLIDALASIEFWRQAQQVREFPAAPEHVAYEMRAYAAINNEAHLYYQILKWDPETLNQLQRLRGSMHGQPTKAIDVLLTQVAERLKEPHASNDLLAELQTAKAQLAGLLPKDIQVSRAEISELPQGKGILLHASPKDEGKAHPSLALFLWPQDNPKDISYETGEGAHTFVRLGSSQKSRVYYSSPSGFLREELEKAFCKE